MRKNSFNKLTEQVSEQEKKNARKAIFLFKKSTDQLDKAKNYLNVIYTPFKDNQDITPEHTHKYRFFLRKFRDKSVDNFNSFKISLYKCIVVMQHFSSDSDIFKLVNTLITSVEDLEIMVNKYVDLFDRLDSKEFSKDLVTSVDKIFKQTDKINELIEDRVIKKISNDILSKTWVDAIGEELNMEIKERQPSLLSIYNREK